MTDRKKLLIVDDEEMIRETLSDYMTDMGFVTRTSSSGEEALTILESESFTHATVDMRLGGMSGFDFIVKAHRIREGIKFLIFTGACDFTIPDEVIMLGITERQVYRKPVRLAEIYHALIEL